MDWLSELNAHSSKARIERIAEAVGDQANVFDEILEACFVVNNPVAMRASWVIQLCCERHPELMDPYLNIAFVRAMESEIEGVRRNFMKVYSEKIDLWKIENLGLILDRCFSIARNPKEGVAVRAYALDLIDKIRKREDGITNEFKQTLGWLFNDESKGLCTKARKLLKSISQK